MPRAKVRAFLWRHFDANEPNGKLYFLFLQQNVGELYGRTTEKNDTARDDFSTEKDTAAHGGETGSQRYVQARRQAVRDTRARDVVLSLEKRQREASRCVRARGITV